MSHVLPRPSAHAAVALLATSGLLAAGLVVTAGSSSAAPPSTPRAEQDDHHHDEHGHDDHRHDDNGHDDHDLRGPQAVKQEQLKQRALQQVLAGTATPQGKNKVVKLSKGQYVELARESTDKVFVVLAEFGDAVHPDHPDLVPDTREHPAQRSAGPRHNTIPEPDRAVDNSTLWKRDYSQAHYEDLYFHRMAAYYRAQSSGRYSIDGDSRQRAAAVRALLHRGEPAVPRLRPLAADGVQLRLRRDQARPRRDAPVRGRPADQLLGHVVRRQRRGGAPGRWAGPARRRPPGLPPLLRRPPAASAGPVVRLDVRARGDHPDHGPQGRTRP